MIPRFCVTLLLAGACLAQNIGSRVADRPLHRFFEVAVSPGGGQVASVEGDSTLSGAEPPIRDLVIRYADGGKAITVALPCGRVRECWPASLAWMHDGKRLAFALRTPGTHGRSIYTVDANGQNMARLLAFDGTITDLSYGWDGRLAVLATEGATKEVGATQVGAPVTGDLDARPHEQRIAILDRGRLDWISPPDLFVYEYDWLPDGSSFVGTAAHGDGDNNWWVAKLYAFDAKGGSERPLYSPPDVRRQIATPRVSRDGRLVAFIGGLMSDFGSTGGDVYLLPLSGGPAVDVTPGMQASARALAWSCDGHLTAELIAGERTEVVDLGDGSAPRERQLLWSGRESLDGGREVVSFACPSKVTATIQQSFNSAPEIEVGPIGEWRPLTRVNADLAKPFETRSVAWKSDGFNVQGWLLLPEHSGGAKLPMVTVVHGGPASAYRPLFLGPGLARKLLERGYAVFQPNPRGSFGQGETFTLANVRDFGHGDLRDILAGIDAAERAAPIDDSRLAIAGGSYGGFMTMWAVTQTNRFKAAVAIAGISDWLSYYGENGIDGWMMPYFGASVYDDPEIYARSSPINFIRNVHTPTLEYVGENDIECPAPQTQEFWHALHVLGVPTSAVIYPGEGHGLRAPDHVADAERRVLEWLDRYLK
jgi:dipeptidyl aminopeptidase/acylaminoacyl peptidase